jgi:hypothetical protein
MRSVALIVVLVLPSAALAHKMDVTAAIPEADPTTVREVTGYDDETPAEGATVELLATDGSVAASGTTNENGVCVLPRPRAGRYRVRVADDGGHAAAVTLDVPESAAELAEARTERRNRWLMAAVGLAVIAGGTVLVRRLMRRPQPVG